MDDDVCAFEVISSTIIELDLTLTAFEDEDLPAITVTRDILAMYEGYTVSRFESKVVKIRPALVEKIPGCVNACVFWAAAQARTCTLDT